MKLSEQQLFSLLSDYNPRLWKRNDIQINCLVCNQRECYISLEENHPWQCFRKSKCSAGSGNIYNLLHKLGRKDIINIKPNITWQDKVSTLILDEQQSLDLTLEECKLPIGFRRIYKCDYLKKRGFISNDYYNYIVGETKLDSKFLNYIIFVLQDTYKEIAYVGRYIGTKETCDRLKIPRYKNSDSDFSKIIGNYDSIIEDVTETLILVEGLFDEKNVSDLFELREADDIKCCFTFKCHVSDEQILKLQNKKIKKLILLYDPDVVDVIKEEAIKLSKYFEVKIALLKAKKDDGSFKDPGEVDIDELQFAFDNLIDPLNFYLKKLQILNL